MCIAITGEEEDMGTKMLVLHMKNAFHSIEPLLEKFSALPEFLDIFFYPSRKNQKLLFKVVSSYG